MRRLLGVFFVSVAITGIAVSSVSGATIGLGIAAVALTKPTQGSATFGALSSANVELLFSKRFAIGAAYSIFDVQYSDDDQDVESDQTVVSAYFAASLLERGAWTTFAKVGGGKYESSLGSLSQSRYGMYASLGERFSMSRRLSAFGEVQYHFPSFGGDDSFPPTGELLRVLAGIEVWIGDKR